MNLHFGEPKNPGGFRFEVAHYAINNKWRKQIQFRPVLKWFGVSWKGDWFCGFIRTGEATISDETTAPPSLPADKV